MGHYKANLRDIEFNLFELFGLEETLASGDYGDLDVDAVKDILRETRKLAEGPLADTWVGPDRNPPVFDSEKHEIELPKEIAKALDLLYDSGALQVALPEEIGGIPAPRALTWALTELLVGSHAAVYFYAIGPAFTAILYALGTDEQKQWSKVIAEQKWGATMVLTEPDAGSDVGAGTTKAVEQPDGTWHIEGVKRFITSATSGDYFDNIFHLVLARPEGARAGTKGLSLFFVPKWHYDFEKRERGERNGVFVTGVEHKMGIKASATCELTFGQHGKPAVGWLVGGVHDGIAQMFDVIENARMLIGIKSIATLSTAYLNALEFAKERVQGSDFTQMLNKDAPRVTIMRHPEVRRSLLEQKAYAEGLRALYLLAAAYQDPAVAQRLFGADEDLAYRVNDFLLPIVKGFGSEQGYAHLADSLQIFGGSGFLQDYPIEQYIRDAKIDTLYEGTTAIQSLDFFFRKIVRDQTAALNHITGQIQEFVDSSAGNGRLKEARELLRAALGDFQATFNALAGIGFAAMENPTEGYKIAQSTVRFLMAAGDLLIGWLLQRQAQIAAQALDGGATGADRDFYEGKIASAVFFAKNILPRLASLKSIVENLDNDIMELPEAAF
ncbi:acyl-CoA dehydrogenase domain protein [Segniliparus rotundus DSM 44985]|uniref:Broad-specificity linear acyl-CoA dehydrogenase FadE5 n=1 Tax=Segniliparus rotundus (strain ATCC BAA-972 / CDC 1076 / CIP 108378 / DSM 44985 / JCM 13578) TaxID=640132 RepID=D6ZAE3_SEGRD|nr:acyl-CoA dehydrogenase [Segniliparus rotundus]ADG96685.1 acyl-CoA dehydrogenase domain protein [Segniliparus rotundus DSM 44985]